jgi:hypothetical protein
MLPKLKVAFIIPELDLRDKEGTREKEVGSSESKAKPS